MTMNEEYYPYTPGPSGPVRDCADASEIASQRPKLAPRIQVPFTDAMDDSLSAGADEDRVAQVNRQLREG